MKKFAAILLLLVTFVSLAACSGGKEQITVYIDNVSDLGYGYKECYGKKELYGRKGIVDKNGKVLLEPNYNFFYQISEGLFIVERMNDNMHGMSSMLINKKGKELIPLFEGVISVINYPEYDNSKQILKITKANGKKYLADTDGARLSPYEFDRLSYDYNDFVIKGYFDDDSGRTYCVYANNGKKLYMLKNGEHTKYKDLPLGYTQIIGNNGEELRYGVINPAGTVIIPCNYEDFSVINQNRLAARYVKEVSDYETVIYANMYDGKGKKFTEDGEFSSIRFDAGDRYGIASLTTKTPSGKNFEYWLIDLDCNAVSGRYDYVRKDDDGNFIGETKGKTEIIKINE